MNHKETLIVMRDEHQEAIDRPASVEPEMIEQWRLNVLALTAAIEALDHAEKVEWRTGAPEWHGFYLITRYTVNQELFVTKGFLCDRDGKPLWSDMTLPRAEGEGIDEVDDVIAWMPLPEPYLQESK